MHEAAIVSALMGILLDRAARHGVARIVRVSLKLGKLRAVEPRALAGCFEMFAEGTPAEGAELVIDTVPIRGFCEDCGATVEVRNFRFACDRCGGGRLTLTSGQELYIESFEAAENGAEVFSSTEPAPTEPAPTEPAPTEPGGSDV